MSFISELKRRNVFKVGVAYAIVAWLLIQIASIIVPAYQAPGWVLPIFVTLVSLGFPIAIFLAWVYELTPEGIKVTPSEGPARFHTQTTGQRLNYFIIGVLVLIVAFLVVDNYILVDKPEVVKVEQSTPPTVIEQAPTQQPSQAEILPNSVAVLPFESMNPDENNVWFAAGLHEEILNQLAKLHNLNIIARTTMLHYAGTDKSIPEIATELNVKTVMEGSVRYANGHVRVTTQLIDPSTNVHLWSETYDHDLKDIFATESDIAMNVANALAAEFSPEEQARIEAVPNASPEAYALYLEALGLLVRWTPENINMAIERIDRALTLDPVFAEGWLLKGDIHSNASIWMPEQAAEHRAESDRAIRRALEINPSLPRAFAAQGRLATTRGEWQQIEEMRRKAIAGGADEHQLWNLYRYILGYLDEFRDKAEIWVQRDPLDAVSSFFATNFYDVTGNSGAALAEYERGRQIFEGVSYRPGHMSALVTLMGIGDRERIKALAASGVWGDNPVYTAVVDNFDTPDKAIAELHSLYDGTDKSAVIQLQHLAVWASWFGDQQLALSALSDIYNTTPPSVLWIWRPMYRDMRREPGFKDLVRKFGFVDFWKKYGWPDLCRPIGDEDFECT